MHVDFSLPQLVKLTIILSFTLFSVSNVHAIDNRCEWDTAFNSIFSNSDPLLNSNNGNDKGKFAWHAHYWIRAYTSMAQITGDEKYLKMAVNLIDHMLFYRDDVRQQRGELDIHKEPYAIAPSHYIHHRNKAAPVWRRWMSGDGWRVLLVDDGQITHAIMRFTDLVYSNPRFISYKMKADTYIKEVQKTVQAHDEAFVFNRYVDIPGSYYYMSRNGGLHSTAVAFNMNATMGVTLLLLDKLTTGEPAYREKAEAILDYFKAHIQKTENNAYTWNYHLVSKSKSSSSSSRPEDFSHGHLDLSFLIMAHQLGLNLSDTVMQNLANTYTKIIYLGSGNLAKYVDGSGSISSYSAAGFAAAYDWIDLAKFNQRALTIAIEVYQKHYQSPTWARPFLGWAEIMRLKTNKELISLPAAEK
jgi:hypothetical protein